MPKVTVLLFSYNHEKFIRACMDSVLAQTFRDFELIVIDDCSTDATWEIVQTYDDPRIQCIRTPRNTAAEWMYDGIDRFGTGEYIAVQNSDDLWLPGKLQTQVEYLDSHPECGAVFTGAQVIGETGEPYEKENRFYSSVFRTENKDRTQWLHEFFYEGNSLCASSVMMRRSLFGQADLKQHGIFSVPDFLQWVRVCSETQIHILPEKLSCYRVRDAEKNISADTPQGHIRFAFENFILLQEFLKLSDEDFQAVFPSSAQYVRGDVFDKKYAYARILLDESSRPEFNLLGLLELYKLLNSDESRKRLETVYGFTHADFIRLTGKRDVFRIIGDDRYQHCTLFYDCGSGLCDENTCVQDSYVLQDGTFGVRFALPEHTQITALRFEPDEGHFRRYSDLKVLVDGEEFPAVPLYAFEQTEGGIAFYTTDPQFEIALPQRQEVRMVEISGQTSRLLPFEVEEKAIWKAAQENRALEQNCRELNGKISELNEKTNNLERDLDEAFANLAAARREQAQEHQAYVALQDQLAQRDARLQTYAEDFHTRSEYLQHHRLKAAVRALLGRLWNQ